MREIHQRKRNEIDGDANSPESKRRCSQRTYASDLAILQLATDRSHEGKRRTMIALNISQRPF